MVAGPGEGAGAEAGAEAGPGEKARAGQGPGPGDLAAYLLEMQARQDRQGMTIITHLLEMVAGPGPDPEPGQKKEPKEGRHLL